MLYLKKILCLQYIWLVYLFTQTQTLTNSAMRFCTDPGVLTPVVDPSDIQGAEKLRNYVCDTVNMNITVLLHQLSESNGIRQLMEDLQVRGVSTLVLHICYTCIWKWAWVEFLNEYVCTRRKKFNTYYTSLFCLWSMSIYGHNN